MTKGPRKAAAPSYLALCLLLGGSGQGIWANMLLQLLGLALIAWAAFAANPQLEREQRQLFWLAAGAFALVLLQLVPLPPSIWGHAGPRRIVAEGYEILGMAPPWLPLSLAPYDSLSSVLSLIPALAMLSATLKLGCKPSYLALALVVGSVAGILLGVLQVGSAHPETSAWYLYPESNFGAATGFFANANHMADLLVVTMPFLAAMVAKAGEAHGGQRYSGEVVLIVGAALVIGFGIALNGSLAGYGLALPVLIASALIALPRARHLSRALIPVSAILLFAAVGWLATTPLSSAETLRSTAATSIQTRQQILDTSLKATAEFMPWGSGFGTFSRVYALYENADRADPNTYVNHAHNDYVEVAVEMGVPGIVLISLFLLWWASVAWRKWKSSDRDPYGRAATVAIAAMLLHSAVDFPLRTAAIGACFAMCLAVMVRTRRAPKRDKSQLWPTRHVVISEAH